MSTPMPRHPMTMAPKPCPLPPSWSVLLLISQKSSGLFILPFFSFQTTVQPWLHHRAFLVRDSDLPHVFVLQGDTKVSGGIDE